MTKIAYNVPEVMAMTGLCRDKVYSAIRNGELTARKHGKRTLILESDLRKFLEALPRIAPAA